MKEAFNKKVLLIVGIVGVCLLFAIGIAIGVKIGGNKAVEPTEVENAIDSADSVIPQNEANWSAYAESIENKKGSSKKDSNKKDSSKTKDIKNESDDNKAVKCTRQVVVDPTTQVAVMSLLVPEGWSTSCSVDWSYVNESVPGRAYVQLSSPNNDIGILYVSHMLFVQTDDDDYIGNYNRNVYHLRTELDYMNSKEYTNHMLGLLNATMQTSIDGYVDSSKEAKLKSAAQSSGQATQEMLMQISGAMLENSSVGYNCDLTDYDGQICIQHGVLNQGGQSFYVETICEEMMYEYVETYYVYSDLGAFGSPRATKIWEPYLFTIGSFADEAVYQENYELYRFLVSNMVLCADFEYLNKTLGSQYVTMATQANIAVSDYAQDVMREYQQETMQQEDAWMQNFSDYIYDQTTYTMNDGAEVAVPIDADYVYSDGNDVIWTDSALYEPGPDYERIN